jgi:serine/threonine-protein kinase
MVNDEPRRSFWHTLPGILTATAGLLTAVTGLYIAVVQNRGDEADASPPAFVDGAAPQSSGQPAANSGAGPAVPARSAGTPTPGNAESAAAAAGPKPWAESDAVLTLADGSQTTVRAESLSNCISVNHSVTLANGQNIAFERMRSIEVVRSDAAGSPNARATIVVTLLDGRAVNGAMDSNCGWFGYNDIGRFDVNVERIRRVDFTR